MRFSLFKLTAHKYAAVTTHATGTRITTGDGESHCEEMEQDKKSECFILFCLIILNVLSMRKEEKKIQNTVLSLCC